MNFKYFKSQAVIFGNDFDSSFTKTFKRQLFMLPLRFSSEETSINKKLMLNLVFFSILLLLICAVTKFCECRKKLIISCRSKKVKIFKKRYRYYFYPCVLF